MEPQAVGGSDDIATMKDLRQQLEESISTLRQTQLDLISSIHHVVPDLISSLDVSLRLISAFNGRQFSPTPIPNTNPNHSTFSNHKPLTPRRRPLPESHLPPATRPKPSPTSPGGSPSSAAVGDGDRLSVVRTMVSVCLLELVPFNEIDSAALLRRLESDQSSATSTEKAALAELGGDLGPLNAVDMALRRIAEENGGLQLEEFSLNGKSLLMIWAIDRNKLLKELPESSGQLLMTPPPATPARETMLADGATQVPSASATGTQRPSQEMWMGPHDPHLAGMPPIYYRAGGPPPLVGPRLGPGVIGMMGIPRMMGLLPLQRPLLGPAMGSQNPLPPKRLRLIRRKGTSRGIEELVIKKSHKEKQQSRTGEEILDLIHRPTAKETATAAKFKTKGGYQLKEYCTNLTKEDCRRQSASYVACEKFKTKGGSKFKEYCTLTKEDCLRQSGSYVACEKEDSLISIGMQSFFSVQVWALSMP